MAGCRLVAGSPTNGSVCGLRRGVALASINAPRALGPPCLEQVRQRLFQIALGYEDQTTPTRFGMIRSGARPVTGSLTTRARARRSPRLGTRSHAHRGSFA
jgi:hypothetical protein